MLYVGCPVWTGELTEPVGRSLAGLPVEPWMGKVLLAGAALGCAQEALVIVAMAATDSVWITPRYTCAAICCGTTHCCSAQPNAPSPLCLNSPPLPSCVFRSARALPDVSWWVEAEAAPVLLPDSSKCVEWSEHSCSFIRLRCAALLIMYVTSANASVCNL